MKSAVSLSLLAVLGSLGQSLAAPAPQADGKAACVTVEEMNTAIDSLTLLMNHADPAKARDAGNALFAENLMEYGDSILSLIGRPLGNPVFTNRTSYVEAVLRQPPPGPITTLFAGVSGCNNIIWHWQAKEIGSKKNEVNGVNRMVIDEGRKVKEMHVEFNSLAWGENIGFKIERPAPVTSTSAPAPTATGA